MYEYVPAMTGQTGNFAPHRCIELHIVKLAQRNLWIRVMSQSSGQQHSVAPGFKSPLALHPFLAVLGRSVLNTSYWQLCSLLSHFRLEDSLGDAFQETGNNIHWSKLHPFTFFTFFSLSELNFFPLIQRFGSKRVWTRGVEISTEKYLPREDSGMLEWCSVEKMYSGIKVKLQESMRMKKK
jgi:hypothetical protein